MKKYKEYKSSEIEWLGDIPTDWDVKKIKWMTSIKRGASPRPIDDPKYFDEDGEYAWVRIADVSSAGMYLEQTTQKMSDLGASLSVKREPGDIFVSIAGTVGKPCITNIKCCIHDGFVYFPDYKGEKKYLYYIFASGAPYKGLGKMGTQLNLNTETIGSIKIPSISLSLQRKIALFLDTKVNEIDTLLNLKQKQIDTLEQQRQSIITEAVTKGLNPNVKMKDSGIEWIGEIPEHWVFTRLDFVSRVKARLGWKGLKAEEYVEDGYAFLSTPNLKERNIDFKNVNYITEERYLESPEIMLEVGDVLLAKDGSTLGIVNVVRSLPKNATVNSSIAVIRPTEKIDSVYFYYYLKSTYIQDVINQIKDGMGVPHLFQADIKKFKILLPPMDEQVVIAKYLDEETLKLEQLAEKVKQQIEALKEYRQALIYEAVTGKINVRDMELD